MSFIKADKLAHFFAGAAIFAFAYPLGIVPAFLVCGLAALGKEIWDRGNGGTPEVLDTLATFFGGVSLYGWHLLLDNWR